MKTKPKILYTTPVLAYPYIGGPALRVANSIKALSRVSELHVISGVSLNGIGRRNAEDYYKKLSTEFSYLPSKKMFSDRKYTGNKILYFLKNSPVIIAERLYRKIKSDIDYLVTYIKKNKIDIVWFGFGNISYDLMLQFHTKLPNIKLVCDTDSIWSRFILRELPFIDDEARKNEIEKQGKEKEQQEKNWVEFADVTTAVSVYDADYYRSISTNPDKIKLFANVIDLQDYNSVPKMPENHSRPSIFMAGSFWENSPMEKAARWFIEEVYPLLINGTHDLKVYIVGNNSEKVLHDISDKNIIITGRVDSVLPYLCHSDLAVVPLFFESGTRFKILEAGACRIPVVSTTLGAEGIDIIDGKNILLADNPIDFADAVTKLINNRALAFDLSEGLNKLVKNKYSIDSLHVQALDIIEYLS